MVRKIIFLIVFVIILVGCDESPPLSMSYDIEIYKDYGKYWELPPESSGVDGDWENVLPALETADISMYKFLDMENMTVAEKAERSKFVFLHLTEPIIIDEIPVEVTISYKSEIYSAKVTINTHEEYDTFYFPRALIGVHFYNESIKNASNHVLFETNGELVAERGEWFLNADRDEYAQFYLEEMLRIIGKEQ